VSADPAAVEKMARHLASVAYRPSGASVSNVEWSEVGETERQQFHRMARHVLSRLAVVEAERDLEQRQATFDRETTRLTIESMRLVTAERDKVRDMLADALRCPGQPEADVVAENEATMGSEEAGDPRIEEHGERPTLRDQFAMAALASGAELGSALPPHNPSVVAARCYGIADATLTRRKITTLTAEDTGKRRVGESTPPTAGGKAT